MSKEKPPQSEQPEYTVTYNDNGDGRTLVRIARDDGKVIKHTVPSKSLFPDSDIDPEQPVELEVT